MGGDLRPPEQLAEGGQEGSDHGREVCGDLHEVLEGGKVVVGFSVGKESRAPKGTEGVCVTWR